MKKKKCVICNGEFDLVNFDLTREYCLQCRRELNNKYSKSYYQKHREEVLAKQKTPKSKMCKRNYRLKKKYGITEEDYQKILLSQNNRCAICNNIVKRLGVDHDHQTGKIRGLLCHHCNAGLGAFRDNPLLLLFARDYLLAATI